MLKHCYTRFVCSHFVQLQLGNLVVSKYTLPIFWSKPSTFPQKRLNTKRPAALICASDSAHTAAAPILKLWPLLEMGCVETGKYKGSCAPRFSSSACTQNSYGDNIPLGVDIQNY